MSDIITIDNLEETFKKYSGTDTLRQFFGRCMVTISNENVWAAGDSDGSITANYFRKHKTTADWQIQKWTVPTFIDQNGQKRMRICRYVGILNKAALAKAAASANTNPIVGKNFVFTGTLLGGTRSIASDLIVRAGGYVQSGVSKKTDYVVTSDHEAGMVVNFGSRWSGVTDKLEEAINSGKKIIGEKELTKMLKDAGYNWNYK